MEKGTNSLGLFVIRNENGFWEKRTNSQGLFVIKNENGSSLWE